MSSEWSNRELIILGAGGHAKVVLSVAVQAGWVCTGIFDDDASKHGHQLLGVSISGPLPEPADIQDKWIVVALGDNSTRKAVTLRYPGAKWATVVHPHAHVHPSVTLGPGTVVFAGAILQPDARLGMHCIINTGATVDHDCLIGDFAHIAPGCHLAGSVSLGEGAFLGIGSSVVPNARVGGWTVLGAGGVVVRDLPEKVVAIGIPASPIKKH